MQYFFFVQDTLICFFLNTRFSENWVDWAMGHETFNWDGLSVSKRLKRYLRIFCVPEDNRNNTIWLFLKFRTSQPTRTSSFLPCLKLSSTPGFYGGNFEDKTSGVGRRIQLVLRSFFIYKKHYNNSKHNYFSKLFIEVTKLYFKALDRDEATGNQFPTVLSITQTFHQLTLRALHWYQKEQWQFKHMIKQLLQIITHS